MAISEHGQRTTDTPGVIPCGVLVSVVIPCLNEERTLALVIDEVRDVLLSAGIDHEVIVSDNGSSDGSREIAEQHGARVVNAPTRGYGAALDHGIRAASGDVIAMLDADFTYDAAALPGMVGALFANAADLVMGSRLRGTIGPGAMPKLHRYVGTPVLTGLINRLLGTAISDCNCGMRVFRKEAYAGWNIESTGMEFASDMIVSSALRREKIVEVPVNFRKDVRDRTPHLRTWNDGMRHLLFILSRAPRFFVNTGIVLMILTFSAATTSLFGPIRVGYFVAFGYHTLILAIVFGLFGIQTFLHGVTLDMRTRSNRTARTLLDMRESTLLLGAVFSVALDIGLLVALVISWGRHGFHELRLLTPSLYVVYLIATVGSLSLGLFHTHMLKRTGNRRT